MRIIQAGRIDGIVRHHEAQRPHDVRRAAQQHLALVQRLAHQRELAVLEVAQAAVDQLGADDDDVCAARSSCLAQQHRQAAAGEDRVRCLRR